MKTATDTIQNSEATNPGHKAAHGIKAARRAALDAKLAAIQAFCASDRTPSDLRTVMAAPFSTMAAS